MKSDRTNPKAPWWCSLWMVAATLAVLIVGNIALWQSSDHAAANRSRDLVRQAKATTERQARSNLEGLQELNGLANDAMSNSGNTGTTRHGREPSEWAARR